jgi:hypothetical protein
VVLLLHILACLPYRAALFFIFCTGNETRGGEGSQRLSRLTSEAV